ncbi:hypothetical protein H0A66_16980 [Alcaligenaceae bacterium]|nr:hypothetical protein [Alcaligenaceae bacterium]
MNTDFPLPGTFIRPVGGGQYSYCYEIAAVVLNDDHRPGAQLQCRLWHLDKNTNQPIDWPAWMPSPPGHPMRYVDAVPACLGAWRNAFANSWGGPLYWKQMNVGAGGQMELFV